MKRHVHISAWELKDNIRSVILDCGRDPQVTQSNLSAPPCVFYGRLSNIHKGSLPQTKDMRDLSLWLYSYFTQTLPSKNDNLNYNFIYLRGLHCLSSGTIYDTCILQDIWKKLLMTGYHPMLVPFERSPNWKTTGHDGIDEFWLLKFMSVLDRILNPFRRNHPKN